MYIHAMPFWVTVCMTLVYRPEVGSFMLQHGVTKYSTAVLCYKHCKLVLNNSVFMVEKINYRIKAVLHARVVKNRMLQNCGIDAHRRFSRLLTTINVLWSTVRPQFSLLSVPEKKGNQLSFTGLVHNIFIILHVLGPCTFAFVVEVKRFDWL